MRQPVKIEVLRGGMRESVHLGHAAVVTAGGDTIWQAGDASFPTFMRSAAKPFQALAVLESGAVEGYGLAEAEIAVMCASHNGEDEHLRAAARILAAAGVAEDMLACGVHSPTAAWVREDLLRRGGEPRPLHNNCSGKHAGMLAVACRRGWPLEGYVDRDHPVQRAVLEAVVSIAGLAAEEVGLAVDGCGVPTFRMPLWNIALAFARLGDPHGAGLPAARAKALSRIAGAMVRHPHLVAGRGRFCTELMEGFAGRLIAKVGAEGVYGLAVPERGWGIAVKVADGSARALAPLVGTVLERSGLLTPALRERLRDHFRPRVKNNRGEDVGEICCRWNEA